MNLLLLLTALLTGLSGAMTAAQPVGRMAIEARQEAAIAVAAEMAQASAIRPWLSLIGTPIAPRRIDGSPAMLGDQRAVLRGERRLN
ncbi:hypothetical protein ACPVPU_09180 [Sphingomonas sp. CJ99]